MCAEYGARARHCMAFTSALGDGGWWVVGVESGVVGVFVLSYERSDHSSHYLTSEATIQEGG